MLYAILILSKLIQSTNELNFNTIFTNSTNCVDLGIKNIGFHETVSRQNWQHGEESIIFIFIPLYYTFVAICNIFREPWLDNLLGNNTRNYKEKWEKRVNYRISSKKYNFIELEIGQSATLANKIIGVSNKIAGLNLISSMASLLNYKC